MEELPKVFGICSVTIGLMSVIQVKTLPMVIMAIILGFVIGELCLYMIMFMISLHFIR